MFLHLKTAFNCQTYIDQSLELKTQKLSRKRQIFAKANSKNLEIQTFHILSQLPYSPNDEI